MTDLVISADDVSLVKGANEHQHTAPAGETFTAGTYIRLDPSTGKFVKGNATSEAELGDGYFALNSADNLGDAVTGLKAPCVVDVGAAVSDLNFGDPVYVSATDGKFADANPLLESGDTPEAEEHFPILAARVVPGWDHPTSPKKLLRLTLQ